MTETQIYTAAVFTNRLMPGQSTHENHLNDYEKSVCAGAPHILESYHYVGSGSMVRAMRHNKAQVFLDSGAFSAKSLGIDITIEEYCDYVLQNIDLIRVVDGVMVASVLDAIGDAHQTYLNQLRMEELGVKPLPCFHQGEPEEYLEWYVANYDYITVGGIVGGNPQQLKIWLDRIWSRYLTNPDGSPKIKVHGFGMTSIPLMARYPWYSCDSSSWVQAASFGSIMDAELGNIKISAKSPSRHEAGKHITTLTPIEKEYVLGRIEERGFDFDRLANTPYARFAYNLSSYVEISAKIAQQRAEGAKTSYIVELF